MIPASVWSSLGEEKKEGQKEKSVNMIHLHPPVLSFFSVRCYVCSFTR